MEDLRFTLAQHNNSLRIFGARGDVSGASGQMGSPIRLRSGRTVSRSVGPLRSRSAPNARARELPEGETAVNEDAPGTVSAVAPRPEDTGEGIGIGSDAAEADEAVNSEIVTGAADAGMDLNTSRAGTALSRAAARALAVSGEAEEGAAVTGEIDPVGIAFNVIGVVAATVALGLTAYNAYQEYFGPPPRVPNIDGSIVQEGGQSEVTSYADPVPPGLRKLLSKPVTKVFEGLDFSHAVGADLSFMIAPLSLLSVGPTNKGISVTFLESIVVENHLFMSDELPTPPPTIIPHSLIFGVMNRGFAATAGIEFDTTTTHSFVVPFLPIYNPDAVTYGNDYGALADQYAIDYGTEVRKFPTTMNILGTYKGYDGQGRGMLLQTPFTITVNRIIPFNYIGMQMLLQNFETNMGTEHWQAPVYRVRLRMRRIVMEPDAFWNHVTNNFVVDLRAYYPDAIVVPPATYTIDPQAPTTWIDRFQRDIYPINT